MFPASPAALTPLPSGDGRYDDAGRTLFAGGEILFVEITIDSADLADLLADPHANEYKKCSARFHNSFFDETIGNVGIRVRGNTSRDGRKKSWKIRFNAFEKGRRFHGVEKMNLNGDRNDPSLVRSKLAWDLMRAARIPSSRTNHVYLTINYGADVRGVFLNVEQVDDLMMKSWFGNDGGSLYKCAYKTDRADLRYRAPGDGGAYRNLGGGKTYDEKNLDDPDYEDLAAFIGFIDGATDEEFAARLGEWIHLDTFLRAMAADIVLGSWDDYWFGANNYYLYHNEETGLFEYIPYDLDNTYGVDFFGIDWSRRLFSGWGTGGFGSIGDSAPPLMTRVMSIGAFRDEIRWYAREIAAHSFIVPLRRGKIDELRSMLEPYAFRGAFSGSTMDNGYTNEVFRAAFDLPASFADSPTPWDYGIKPFIENRSTFVTTAYSPPVRPRVRISELLARNRSGDRDEAGEREDWVELQNFGASRVELGGMYLTDDPARPKMWRVPDGTSIPSSGYLRFWCDGEEEDGPLHTSFRLDADGDGVALFFDDARLNLLVDYIDYERLGPDISWGRNPEGDGLSPVYMARPTPGAANVYSGNIAPFIEEVRVDPPSPRENEAPVITARITDLDGSVVSARVFFRPGGDEGSAPLADDGAGADGVAGDGVFTSRAGAYGEGTFVGYWIEATDDSAAVAFSPRDAPSDRHGYQVDYIRPALFINEVFAAGDTTPGTGDWVELFNGGASLISLAGLTLSDRLDEPDRFVLPDLLLEPGGFLLVRCEGRPERGELHAPFRLASAGGGVGLFAPAAAGRVVVDTVTYAGHGAGESYRRRQDGGADWLKGTGATPGATNGGDSIFPEPWRDGSRPFTVWPNPAPPAFSDVILAFRLPATGRVRVRLYDVAGREKVVALDGVFGPGDHRVRWEAAAGMDGIGVAPGVYLLRLEANGKHESTRITILP